MKSETDGAVKYKIFRYVGGFPDGETHEFYEAGVLGWIPVEKAELCADHENQAAHRVTHLRGFRRGLGGEPEDGGGDEKRREPGKQLCGSRIFLVFII